MVPGSKPRSIPVRTVFAPKPTPTSRAAMTGRSRTPTALRFEVRSGEACRSPDASPEEAAEAVAEPGLASKPPDAEVIEAQGTSGR